MKILPTILSSLSDNTWKQYENCLHKWWKFCLLQKYDPLVYDINHILEFFVTIQESDVSYSSLNSHRAAISLILPTRQEDGAILQRFFKGAYNLKPPTPKYSCTWDTQLVLGHLEKLYPLDTLTLENLTYKLVTLLSLTSAQRVQTLAKVCIKNITHTDNQTEIRVEEKLKTSGYKKNQPLMVFPIFRQNPALCVATTLKHYLNVTSNNRNDEDRLLLTFKKPYHAATSQTISRWIKKVLNLCGIDISKFAAHSTRHASTSAALRAGVNIESIRNTAGWSHKSDTFNRFYNRPVTHDPTLFAERVLLGQNNYIE